MAPSLLIADEVEKKNIPIQEEQVVAAGVTPKTSDAPAPEPSMMVCASAALKLMHAAIAHGVHHHFYQEGKEAFDKNDAEGFQRTFEDFVVELLGGDLREKYATKHPDLVAKVDVGKIVGDILDKKVCKKLYNFLPTHPSYIGLKKTLLQYRTVYKKMKDKPEPKVVLTKNYKKGDKGGEIKDLRRYLQFYDYLPHDGVITDVYDDELVEAVKKFQEYHTHENDGVIGPQTREAFKLTLKDRINLIKLNLKRWRVFSPLEKRDDTPQRLIFVNIGSYTVEAIEDGKRKLFMKAIVGMPGRRTPLFKAPMTQVIFNPSWWVPPSIATKDKLNKIIADPDYLDRSGYTVTDEFGMVLSPFEVNWQDFSGGYFPVRLRQHPGKSNALGQIKFDIKNRYTIYLHHTNQPELFKKISRAKSSGCIRLEEPIALANWVFEGEDLSKPEVVAKLMTSNVTKSKALKSQIPVYFIYITAWVDDEGHLRISDDPYNIDKEELKMSGG